MSLADATLYHWTVEDFQKLGEKGFFQDRRVELLNGEIYHMSPIGYRHAEAVTRLAKKFTLLARDRYEVRTQLPILLDDQSLPEPDLCLVDPITSSLRHHPKPEHVRLLIEVSHTTLGFDRGDKRAAYALQGIGEYWLLDLENNALEVYREPRGDRYRKAFSFADDDEVVPLAFPDLKLRVGDYIP